MARTLSPDEIAALTVDERLDLIDALWDSLGHPDEGPLILTPEQAAILDERIRLHDRGELPGEDAAVVIARLKRRAAG